MAEKACHVFGSATQVGLTQALGLNGELTMRALTSSIAALLIGLVQLYVVTFCLSFIALYSPVPGWLVHNGFSGIEVMLGVTATDFPIIFVLWLPAAYLLMRLRPLSVWVYLAFAVVPAWIWLNRLVISQGNFSGSVLLSWVPELVIPAVATLVMLMFTASQRPNNSFNPKPLRSSKMRH